MLVIRRSWVELSGLKDSFFDAVTKRNIQEEDLGKALYFFCLSQQGVHLHRYPLFAGLLPSLLGYLFFFPFFTTSRCIYTSGCLQVGHVRNKKGKKKLGPAFDLLTERAYDDVRQMTSSNYREYPRFHVSRVVIRSFDNGKFDLQTSLIMAFSDLALRIISIFPLGLLN